MAHSSASSTKLDDSKNDPNPGWHESSSISENENDIDLNKLIIDSKRQNLCSSPEDLHIPSISPLSKNLMLPFQHGVGVPPINRPNSSWTTPTDYSLLYHSNQAARSSFSRSPSVCESFYSPSLFPSWNKYHSSSAASIFGGRQKQLISPSRLSSGYNANPFVSQWYSRNGHSTDFPLFGNPISRSSSQSSGFFSLHGNGFGISPSPSVYSGQEANSDRISLISEPYMARAASPCNSFVNNGYLPANCMTTYSNDAESSNFKKNRGNTCSRFGPRGRENISYKPPEHKNSNKESSSGFEDDFFSDDESDSSCTTKISFRNQFRKCVSSKGKGRFHRFKNEISTNGLLNASEERRKHFQEDDLEPDSVQSIDWKNVIVVFSLLLNTIIFLGLLLWTVNLIDYDKFDKWIIYFKLSIFDFCKCLSMYFTHWKSIILPNCNITSSDTCTAVLIH